MIVAGDAEPILGKSQSFEFAPAAAAIVLSPGKENEGFAGFKTSTFPQYKNTFESRVAWTSWKNKKQNILFIHKKENYLDQCVECAAQSLEKFLRETSLRLRDIDLLIPSQSPRGFPSRLKKQTGLGDRVIEVDNKRGELHTAGPAIALDSVWSDKRFKEAGNVIFLTVGSGITTAIALYKNKSGISR